MKVIIIGVLVLTLGVAAVSTYLIRTFQTPEAMEQLEREKAIPKKYVLVAGKSLDVGKSVTAEDVTWQVWVDEALLDTYIVREEKGVPAEIDDLVQPVIGALVRQPIAKGEPLTSGKLFKHDSPGFLAGALGPGMRATAIKISEDTAVAGFVFPGDRVDVLLSHNKALKGIKAMDPGGAPEDQAAMPVITWVTETILRDKKVLAVGQSVGGEGKAKVAKTITLEVTPKEAEVLAVAKSMGKLSFVLRSLTEKTKDGGKSGSGEERSFTSDIETSPFLEEMRRKLMAGAQDDAPGGEMMAAPAPAPAIKVYRGQSKSTEEVRR